MTRTGCIYMATVNGKHYVGKTLNFTKRRWSHEKARDDTYFHRAVLKHGIDAWRILSDDIPEASLSTHERFWIRFYDTFHNGYNSTEGGDGLSNPSVEVRERIASTLSSTFDRLRAEGQLIWKRTEARAEQARRHSATLREQAARGEHSSQQTGYKAKVSATMKEKGARGELWNQQPEAKARIREASARGELGTQTPEARANMSRAMLERTARGENPMQIPEIRDRAHAKAQQTMKAKGARGELWNQDPVRMANDKADAQREAGQQFLLDMEVD